jgi:hypothetical protein
MFPAMIFAPTVRVDLRGSDPPREARERTIAAIIEQTLKQRPS